MAAETRKSRKSNFSQEEIDVLMTTVLQNHNILYGETSKSFFHKEIRNQVWNIILEEVNKVSLERRTLNEVKNKWKKCQYNLRAADQTETVDYVDCDDLDSMPLQQRLSQNHNEVVPPGPAQEPVLQSQSISPTKLKVTRQGAKPQQPPAKPPTPVPQNPEVCLRWNSHHTNMQSAFPNLLMKEQYVDATLVSEGKTLKCHRMILSSCSPYFEEVLSGISPFQHPILFMKDIPFWILKALCDFMYAGEVHIFQDKLQEILNVAEALKIKGLAGTPDTREDIKPPMPEIKQEIDATPPPKVPEKPPKEEKEEEPPLNVKPAKHETAKVSKKKEDKKSKHSSQPPKEKEKEKEKIVEEPPAKVLPKVAPKVVPKVVLPKPTPKTAVRNVMKNVLQKVPKPSTSKATHASRKSEASKKSDKSKADVNIPKEKEKEKEKPPLKKDNINDPLDLLQPVYEEIAKEDPPPPLKSINPAKLKERSNVPVRRGVNKKVKKRRYAEYAEEREESPPPVFPSRKGTRSRPNVKIPKFFHTHYEDSPKETTDATIVREPHTDQSDPLIGVEEVEEIKAEPLDVEENTIEMEENLVNFMQDQEMASQEEEIIGNYDSPIVNIKQEVKRNTPNIFKKMLDPQPVIMNIHTVTEIGQADVRLLNINEENLKIVDISKISTGENRLEETITGDDRLEETITGDNRMEETIIGSFDSAEDSQGKMISSVQSMAEICAETRGKGSDELHEAEVVMGDDQQCTQERANIAVVGEERFESVKDPQNDPQPARDCDVLLDQERAITDNIPSETDLRRAEADPLGSQPETCPRVEETLSTALTPLGCEGSFMETSLALRIENVRTEIASQGDANMDNQESALGSNLDSLEDKIEDCVMGSQGSERLEGLETKIESGGVISQGHESLGSLEAKLEDCVMGSQGSEILEGSESKFESGGVNSQGQERLGSLETKLEGCGIGSQGLDNLESLKAKMDTDVAHLESEGGEEISKVGAESDDMHSDGQDGQQQGVDDVGNKEEIPKPTEDNASSIIREENNEDNLEKLVEHPEKDSSSCLDTNSAKEEIKECHSALRNFIVEAEEICADGERNSSTQVIEEQTTTNPDLETLQIPVTIREETSVDTGSQERAEESCLNNSVSESIVTEGSKIDIQNTPSDSMAIDSEFQNNEQELSDRASDVQQEVPEYFAPEKSIIETEISEVVTESDNANTIRLENSAEANVCLEEITDSSKLEGPLEDLEKSEVIVQEAIEESTDNIEAELEQCLASTSSIVSIKPSEVKLKHTFEDDEDFTKDIEFEEFVHRNKPANYVGSEFDEDFEMEQIEEVESDKKEDRQFSDHHKDCSSDVNVKDSKVETELVGTGSDVASVGVDRVTGSEGEVEPEVETEKKFEKTGSDEAVAADGVSRSEEKVEYEMETESKFEESGIDRGKELHVGVTINEDNLLNREEISSRLHNSDEDMIASEPVAKISRIDEDISEISEDISLSQNTSHSAEKQDHLHEDIPETTENFKEHHNSMEDEQNLEDRLLADLDDDIEMKDASSSAGGDDGVEKTLEMIVNDLNESLGEMRK